MVNYRKSATRTMDRMGCWKRRFHARRTRYLEMAMKQERPRNWGSYSRKFVSIYFAFYLAVAVFSCEPSDPSGALFVVPLILVVHACFQILMASRVVIRLEAEGILLRKHVRIIRIPDHQIVRISDELWGGGLMFPSGSRKFRTVTVYSNSRKQELVAMDTAFMPRAQVEALVKEVSRRKGQQLPELEGFTPGLWILW